MKPTIALIRASALQWLAKPLGMNASVTMLPLGSVIAFATGRYATTWLGILWIATGVAGLNSSLGLGLRGQSGLARRLPIERSSRVIAGLTMAFALAFIPGLVVAAVQLRTVDPETCARVAMVVLGALGLPAREARMFHRANRLGVAQGMLFFALAMAFWHAPWWWSALVIPVGWLLPTPQEPREIEDVGGFGRGGSSGAWGLWVRPRADAVWPTAGLLAAALILTFSVVQRQFGAVDHIRDLADLAGSVQLGLNSVNRGLGIGIWFMAIFLGAMGEWHAMTRAAWGQAKARWWMTAAMRLPVQPRAVFWTGLGHATARYVSAAAVMVGTIALVHAGLGLSSDPNSIRSGCIALAYGLAAALTAHLALVTAPLVAAKPRSLVRGLLIAGWFGTQIAVPFLMVLPRFSMVAEQNEEHALFNTLMAVSFAGLAVVVFYAHRNVRLSTED